MFSVSDKHFPLGCLKTYSHKSLKNKAKVDVCDPSAFIFNCSGNCDDNLNISDIGGYFWCTPLRTNSSLPSLLIVEVTIHTSNIHKKVKSLIDFGFSLNLISKETFSLLINDLQKSSDKIVTLKAANGERLGKVTQLSHKITISVRDLKENIQVHLFEKLNF
jgi:hypothetical protein